MTKRRWYRFFREFVVGLVVIILSGCVAEAKAEDVFTTEKGLIRVDVIAEGLRHPWGLAMMPDGRLLVTEREGRLRVVDEERGLVKRAVGGLPKVAVGGQGGLLDIAVDPDFGLNRMIYFSYSEAGRGAAGRSTAVGRGRLNEEATALTGFERIFTMNRKTRLERHFGSRLVFSLDGTLFVTIGDRGEGKRAQNGRDHAGSVLRINKDGSIPKGNPHRKRGGFLGEIWSIGHRNAQGAALHPKTGELWTVEHGAAGGDEINRPLAGKNYGWPVISYGRHYSGAKIGEGSHAEGMEQPVYYWDPSIAPSGMSFYESDEIKGWKGSLFVGALKDRMVVRLTLDGDRVVSEERLLKGEYGRIRDVRAMGDGSLWLLTDEGNGKVLRVTSGE